LLTNILPRDLTRVLTKNARARAERTAAIKLKKRPLNRLDKAMKKARSKTMTIKTNITIVIVAADEAEMDASMLARGTSVPGRWSSKK